MKEGFEKRFMEVQSGLISLCLEATGDNVDKIYAYASIEEKVRFFNVFFEQDGEIKTFNLIGVDDDIQWQVLKLGVGDLGKLKDICLEYETPCPTELKMHYDVQTGSYDAAIKYEPVCGGQLDVACDEVFHAWIDEEKGRMQAQQN